MKKSMIFGTLAIMAMTAAGAGIAGAHNPYHDGYRSGYHRTYEYGHGNYGCDGYRTPHMFRGRSNAYYNDNYQENTLTKEQISQLDEMREKHFKTMQPLFEELRLKNMELDVFRSNPNVKPDQLDKLVREIIALENKVDSERQNFRSQIGEKFGIEYSRGMGRPMYRMYDNGN